MTTRTTGMEEQDVALKILHTADWHLGLRFASFGEDDSLKLTRARLEAVDKLLGLAESYAVNAVLCAGDIFDISRSRGVVVEGPGTAFSAA